MGEKHEFLAVGQTGDGEFSWTVGIERYPSPRRVIVSGTYKLVYAERQPNTECLPAEKIIVLRRKWYTLWLKLHEFTIYLQHDREIFCDTVFDGETTYITKIHEEQET